MTQSTIFGAVDRTHEEERRTVNIVYNGPMNATTTGRSKTTGKMSLRRRFGIGQETQLDVKRIQQENSSEDGDSTS